LWLQDSLASARSLGLAPPFQNDALRRDFLPFSLPRHLNSALVKPLLPHVTPSETMSKQ
jgi:hypothetical protein